jgi:anti-anti-sigma regulatory factor/anti-sigma regulatory factor (Ser/Thr protein kinase)
MTGFICERTADRGSIVVRLGGVLDLAATALLRGVLLKCLADQPAAIVVDATVLAFAEQAFLTVFAAAARNAAAWPGIPFVMCTEDPELLRGLNALGIDRHVTVVGSVDEAHDRVAHRDTAGRVRAVLPPVPGSVVEARDLLGEACREWRLEHLGPRAATVLTELVANSVLHAATRIELSIRRSSRYLHLAVRDYSVRPARLVGPGGPADQAGRGLLIVDALTAAWGCTSTVDGKVTWASIVLRPLRN